MPGKDNSCFYLQVEKENPDCHRIQRLCNGHPYTLSMLKKVVNSSFSHQIPSKFVRLTAHDVERYNAEVAKSLHEVMYQSLTPADKDILMTLSLFDCGISVKNLHKVRSGLSGHNYYSYSAQPIPCYTTESTDKPITHQMNEVVLHFVEI